MKDLTKQAVEKIKRQQLKPISKNVFVAKSLLWWLGFVVAVVLGGISLAVAVFLARDLDWDVYGHLGDGLAEFLLVSIPHLWLAFVALFAFLSYRNLRSTENGYKYGSFPLLAIVIVSSALLGWAFDALGMSRSLNEIFLEKVPGYQRIVQTKQRQWAQPEKGLLSGEILDLRADGGVSLVDFEGKRWQVNVDQQTVVRGSVKLDPSEKIKIIGNQVEEDEPNFDAEEIRPWGGKRKGNGSEEGNGSENGERGQGRGTHRD